MIIHNSLYIFQKDFYNTSRFITYCLHGYFLLRSKKLGDVHYTMKVKLLLFISITLQSLSIGGIVLWVENVIAIVVYSIAVVWLYPIYLVIGQIITLPVEYILKKRIVSQAKKKLQQLSHIHIIGIVGSYGKTSTKHVLYHTYKNIAPTIMTSGNTNTLLWVANFILHEMQPHHKIVIIEMGEHYAGDIKDLCNLINPETIIVTWLTLQHAERMGSIQEIEKVIFEFRWHPSVKNTILNADDPNIHSITHKYPSSYSVYAPDTIQVLENFGWIQYDYQGLQVQTKLLAKHASIFVQTALYVWQYLDLDIVSMIKNIQHMPYIEHRLQLIYNPVSDLYVIDDSYNGNIQWVVSTIQLVQDTHFAWKKIYITPWLMELGDFSEEIHTQMANLLHGKFDYILLIENINTKIIYNKLVELGENPNKIIMFTNRDQAHTQLKKYTSPHSVIIFQNDIPQWF